MITCILLAAGESARFGSPKPLAPIGKKTVIESIQEQLLKTSVSEIIVVLGAASERIAPFVLKNPRIKKIINTNYVLGQTSSFKTGLSAVDPQASGLMLLPVDMPAIKTATINLLIDVFLEKKPLLLMPTFQDKNGHPPIFSAKLSLEFKNLKDDEPLSTIQHRYADAARKVPVTDQGTRLSFNTPEEFKELLILLGSSPA
jgi:CTP:molybdopterin cytidylyltransferase MocA